MHDYWCYFKEVTEPFNTWINNDDSIVVANTMIVMLQRTMAMLHGQINTQGKTFLQSGGFKERMYQTRQAERSNADNITEVTPKCPECGKPMIKRTARTGAQSGIPFWGCSAFPECKGTRQIEKNGED